MQQPFYCQCLASLFSLLLKCTHLCPISGHTIPPISHQTYSLDFSAELLTCLTFVYNFYCIEESCDISFNDHNSEREKRKRKKEAKKVSKDDKEDK